MYHCHLLTHEDGGMMGQFVVSNPLSVNKNYNEDDILIYPNPSSNFIKIELPSNIKLSDLSIYDSIGRLMNFTITNNGNTYKIENLQKGIFFLKCSIDDKSVLIKKIIMN